MQKYEEEEGKNKNSDRFYLAINNLGLFINHKKFEEKYK